MAENKKATLSVGEKEYEILLKKEDGKIFAETEVEGFGFISVPDMGKGEEGVLEEIRYRIINILRDNEAGEGGGES